MTFVLLLNDMRSAHSEDLRPVARASTADALLAYMARERVRPYTTDGHWQKCYRIDGPLEWYNDPIFPTERHIIEVGAADDWAAAARADYATQVGHLLEVLP